MPNFRLFTKDEFLDIKSRLQIYIENELTDYAKLFTGSYLDVKGGYSTTGLQPYFEIEEERPRSITSFWIEPNGKENSVSITNGVRYFDEEDYTGYGIKTVVDFSEIEEESTLVGTFHLHRLYTWGEYPQRIATPKETENLDHLLKLGFIEITGKTYTYNKNYYDNSIPEEDYFLEYQVDDKKFIHLHTIEEGKIKSVWVEVEPIEWVVDDKTNLAFQRKVITTGIPLKDKNGNDVLKPYIENTFNREMEKQETYKQLKLNI